MREPTITLYNADCLPAMREMEDGQFKLAIVDPPYGVGIVGQFQSGWSTTGVNPDTKEFDTAIPPPEYFSELSRVSVNQIIWGGNYFISCLSSTRCMVIWDKMNGDNAFADAELAWTSFDKNVRIFKMHHFSAGYDRKIHPTQKPVALYKWLLKNYATPGDTILDTHLGSGSIAIACHDYGFDLVGYELDPDYYAAAVKRLDDHRAQMRLNL